MSLSRTAARGRLGVAILVAVLLSGCSSRSAEQAPHTTGQPTGSTVATTTAATISTATTAGTVTTTRPTGTVVPFRTVAPDSAAGKRVGLIAPTGSDAFGKAVTDSVAGQVKAAGAELVSCDPADDPALVLDCARRMTTEHVDGWITVQAGDLGQALCDAGPPKVPLITIAATPGACQTGSVGADDEQAGFLVGQALGRAPRNRTNCEHSALIIVANSASGSVSTERISGIRRGFATECPQQIIPQQVLDAGTQDRAYDAFSVALAAVPADTDVLVAAVNDGAALGIVAAVPQSRAAHVVVAAIGADQRARCEIVANPVWIGDAALFPDRYGDVAVPALLDAMRGKDPAVSMYVPSTFVTSSTLGNFYDLSRCPAT
jgi:ribose transport system substrate-binding protein